MSDTLVLKKIADVTSQSAFELHHKSMSGAMARISADGWRQFNELPMPTRKDERWRFADILDLSLVGYHISPKPADAVVEELIARSHMLENECAQLIFIDGHLCLSGSLNGELEAQGVLLTSLEEANRNHAVLFEQHYFRRAEALGAQKMQALHKAYGGQGAFIHVPKGVKLSMPIVCYHWSATAQGAIFPHTLVVAEEESAVTVVDIYLSANPDLPGLSCGIAHHWAGRGAKVFRKSVQDFSHKMLSFQTDLSVVEEEAELHTAALHLGGYKARFENQAYLEGARSKAMLSSLTVASREDQFDQRSLQVHRAPEATSDLLYKNALLGDARTLFAGLILVDPVAQKTDAYQTNRNLLLSPTAEALALPGLEIEANDVKCSHGATTSELDAEELFYLRSRGIALREARELLVQGFFEEVLERIEYSDLVENLRSRVRVKLLDS
jgi:Fe-S cluster assembly protein SufD